MKAVIFDLFGTLTDPTAELTRRTGVEHIGSKLGVDPVMFWERWSGSFSQRIVGAYGDTDQTLRKIAAECGVTPSADLVASALAEHLFAAELLRAPRPGALDLLTELRERGFRLGLLSDCGSEVAESWDRSPYAPCIEVAVLSWLEGTRKPNPSLYLAAASRLGVAAAECWYVGDGGGHEHTGAQAVGMRPVLVTNVGVPGVAELRADADDFLPSDQVADLGGVLALVGHPAK